MRNILEKKATKTRPTTERANPDEYTCEIVQVDIIEITQKWSDDWKVASKLVVRENGLAGIQSSDEL